MLHMFCQKVVLATTQTEHLVQYPWCFMGTSFRWAGSCGMITGKTTIKRIGPHSLDDLMQDDT